MKRLAAPLFVSAFLVAGCGGGDERPATAKEGDAFCEASEDVDDATKDLDGAFLSGDPDDLEEGYGEALAASEAALKRAPKDILEVVTVLRTGQVALGELLEENDWDLAQAIEDKDFEELAADEEIEEASEELDEYLEDNCGIEPDEDEAESGSDDESESTIASDVDDALSDVITKDNFLQFYALGAGVEITDEMEDCFLEEVSDFSDDEFAAAASGTGGDDASVTIGLAIIKCEIPVG
jgi:hypothetical protein